MVDADTGEDAIAVCRATGYAANVEKAVSRISAPPAAPAEVAMHKESTPKARSVDDLRKLFPDLPAERMLKTVLGDKGFLFDDGNFVAHDGTCVGATALMPQIAATVGLSEPGIWICL